MPGRRPGGGGGQPGLGTNCRPGDRRGRPRWWAGKGSRVNVGIVCERNGVGSVCIVPIELRSDSNGTNNYPSLS